MLISAADAFTGQYRDKGAFMQALADRLMVAAKREWQRAGGTIEAVSWTEEIAGTALAHPIAAVTISPGDRPVTVAALREHFKAERQRARQAEQQGRLI